MNGWLAYSFVICQIFASENVPERVFCDGRRAGVCCGAGGQSGAPTTTKAKQKKRLTRRPAAALVPPPEKKKSRTRELNEIAEGAAVSRRGAKDGVYGHCGEEQKAGACGRVEEEEVGGRRRRRRNVVARTAQV
jgi:hypothetical protein